MHDTRICLPDECQMNKSIPMRFFVVYGHKVPFMFIALYLKIALQNFLLTDDENQIGPSGERFGAEL